MKEQARSPMEYWEFAQAVLKGARYIRDARTETFLSAVAASAEKRSEILRVRSPLYRAQLGTEWEEDSDIPMEHYVPGDDDPVPYALERMKPLKDRAVEAGKPKRNSLSVRGNIRENCCCGNTSLDGHVRFCCKA
jgi:hypothetical protein